MASGDRRRFLPSWMRAAGQERLTATPPKARRRLRRRQQQQEQQQSAAGPRTADAVVYCMNEAELVDVALAVLAEYLRCQEGEEKAPSETEEEQELRPTPEEAPGSTADTRGGSDCSPALPSHTDTGTNAERTSWEDSQDDILKYVREIFFS